MGCQNICGDRKVCINIIQNEVIFSPKGPNNKEFRFPIHQNISNHELTIISMNFNINSQGVVNKQNKFNHNDLNISNISPAPSTRTENIKDSLNLNVKCLLSAFVSSKINLVSAGLI